MREIKDFRPSGYHGKDSMREKAKKAFGSSMSMNMEPKRSRSEPSKLKPLFYAEGGEVASEPKMKRGGSHKAKGPKTPSLNIESAKQAKSMGSKKRCYNDGGEVGDAKLLGSNPATWSPNAYKRGGKAHAKKKFDGGPIGGEAPKRPLSRIQQALNFAREVGSRRPAALKKGGKAEGYAMGGVGKIRHGQSTKSGKPKMRRVVKGR